MSTVKKSGFRRFLEALPPEERWAMEAKIARWTNSAVTTVRSWCYARRPNKLARRIIACRLKLREEELFDGGDE